MDTNTNSWIFMDISILQDLGLTNSEIKVYTKIVEIGLTKAGPVVRATGLQNSVVHLALGQLVDKGLISFVRQGKIKHYQPTDPRSILRFIDEKREQAASLVKELIARQSKFEQPDASIYMGFSGFKAMCYEFIDGAQPGDEYLFFAYFTKSKEYEDEVNQFYAEFAEERIRRGLVLKGISHKDVKPYFQKFNRSIENVLFVDFPVLMFSSICNNKVIFTPWEESQVSFMITSPQLANNLTEYFYSIWDRYR